MPRTAFLAFFPLVLGVYSTTALAVTVAWDGGTNGNGSNWSVNNNWVGDVLPASGDDILFSNRSGNPGLDLITPMSVGASSTYGLISFSDANGKLPPILNIRTNSTPGDPSRTLTINSGIELVSTTSSVVFDAATNGTLSIQLGNNANFTTSGTSQLTLGPAISGSFGIAKSGTGTMVLSSTGNNYSGATTINAGTLQLGNAGVLPDTSVVLLNGGTLNTGGLSETTGALDLDSSSTINLNGGGTLAFANSSVPEWEGSLAIWNWTPGQTRVRFGTTSSGLTGDQLSVISVYTGQNSGPLGAVSLDASGFLVVVPEPGAVLAGLALLGAVGWRERRHFLRVRPQAA